MRHPRQQRPPLLEKVVFGLAFLLAGILAYYAFQNYRRQSNAAGFRPADSVPPVDSANPSADRDAALPELERSGARGAVSGVPPIGVTQPAKSPKRR